MAKSPLGVTESFHASRVAQQQARRVMPKSTFDPGVRYPGSFSARDGTIDFYLRVRTYLNSDSVVLDLGAGRGAWFEEKGNTIRRKMRHIAPDVTELIAIDVDPVVMENRSATRCAIMLDGKIPMQDNSVDVIVSDFVCEHITDPQAFMIEVGRVLRPGGMFCARTPHAAHYVAIAARFVPNAKHAKTLSWLQPNRKSKDIFPTVYRMNTLQAIEAAAPGWVSQSFIYRTEPGYFFGSRFGYSLMSVVHNVLPSPMCGNLFIFIQKPV